MDPTEPETKPGISSTPVGMMLVTESADQAAIVPQFFAAAEGMSEIRLSDCWTEITVSVGEARSRFAKIGAVERVHSSSNNGADLVLEIPTEYGQTVALARFMPRYDEVKYMVAGYTAAGAEATLAALHELTPTRPPQNDPDKVDLTFWMHHPMHGAVSRRRGIDRQNWDDVKPNYPSSVRSTLAELCGYTSPPQGGQLLLFHGPPGTGKTRFAQTLASEWADWCDVHYIVDADEMLASALYLNTVMLDGFVDDDRWRLIVLEDGDEFVDAEAKYRVGQGVSRLLNVADGMLGQGLKIMVLVSTNVRDRRFSPAVVRNGRCGALIEFPPFPPEEAAEWLAANDLPAPGKIKKMTLADLYETSRPAGRLSSGDVDPPEKLDHAHGPV